MPNDRVVLTGGNGFVGKYLQAELRRAWPSVKIETWDLPDVDITKPETYRERLKKMQPDWIVHLAAVSSVVMATQNPEAARRVNVVATGDLLVTAKELSAATRVFVTSTADIYGQGSATPLPELPLAQARPHNIYGQSKWEMEQMIETIFLDRVLRVRAFPHIGPGQGPGFVTADFASQIAAIELEKQEPILHVGNLESKRDFTDVRDVVRAYRLLMEKGTVGEVYHVASGKAVSIQTVLDTLLGLSKIDIVVEQDPTRMRASDIKVLVGDATKLRQATGWQPEIPLAQSLRDVMDWWRGTYKRNN